jgi:hypothetical protein
MSRPDLKGQAGMDACGLCRCCFSWAGAGRGAGFVLCLGATALGKHSLPLRWDPWNPGGDGTRDNRTRGGGGFPVKPPGITEKG